MLIKSRTSQVSTLARDEMQHDWQASYSSTKMLLLVSYRDHLLDWNACTSLFMLVLNTTNSADFFKYIFVNENLSISNKF